MRLICPNCGAEYEVASAAIPAAGRDVQCSNCGHAWFQAPHDDEAEPEVANSSLSGAGLASASAIAGAASPDLAAVKAGQMTGGIVPAAAGASGPGAAGGLPETPRGPKTLDETVLAVLREEAEREAVARRGENRRTIEIQPDLGLESGMAGSVRDRSGRAGSSSGAGGVGAGVAGAVAASAAAELAARAAGRTHTAEQASTADRTSVAAGAGQPAGAAVSGAALGMQGKPEVAPPVAGPMTGPMTGPGAARGAARRELLPDIEEINSTLRATGDRGEGQEDFQPDPPVGTESRTAFRSGFVLMMVVAVVLTLSYTMAPRIVAQMPGAAPMLQRYVTGVNAARTWLDGLVKSATGAVEGVSGS